MSLFVNPSGKIVMAGNTKPIECLRCPCENIVGDPYMYCVTENFYSGDNCTGGLQTTLEHQCMCMDDGCQGLWDKAAFCQGQVQYVYESGPHGISCPDNCVAAACPSDCSGCTINSIVVSGFSSTCGAFFNGSYTVNQVGCSWDGLYMA